jgi:4-hydroxy-tetrahydrodipicolinate synthase
LIDLAGIIPALVTPMHDDDSVAAAAIPSYVEWLIDQGPIALAVNVDTGEGPHLSRDERQLVLETVVATTTRRVHVVAGVGGPSTRDAVVNARAAAAAGADALLVFPVPSFLSTPLRADMLLRYHEAIAEAVDLPLILFQLQPALGGVLFPAEILARLLTIPSVVALKEASFDPLVFTQVRTAVAASGRAVTLLTGNDNFIAESMLLGAEGALLGFATLGTREHVDLLEAVRRRDMATVERIGPRLQRLADVIFAPPVVDYRARIKEALRLLGVIPGATVRPPLLAIRPAEVMIIADALRAASLLT